MSATTVAALLAAVGAELQVLAQRSRDGFDVAPVRRARVEGMAQSALLLGADAEELLGLFRRILPADAQIDLDVEAGILRFDMWQRRAPVEPTTST